MNLDTAAATAPRANLRAQAAFAAVMRLAQLRREPVDGLEIRGVLEGFGAEWTEVEMVEELSRQLNLPMPVWGKVPDDGRLPMLALSPEGGWGVVTARNGDGHWVTSWWDGGERKFREETVQDFAKGHRFARWSVAARFIASKSPTLRLVVSEILNQKRSLLDIAAGTLIADRAGATVTDRIGAPIRFNAPRPQAAGVVVAAPGLHGALMGALTA